MTKQRHRICAAPPFIGIGEVHTDVAQTRRADALARLDEKALGGLLMHFMLETVIAAHLLGVDPFGQPAVETSKRLTREYLVGSAR